MLIPKLKYIFRCVCNGKYKQKDIDRFISKIDTAYGLGPWGNCWEWTGPLRPHGRGQFRLNISRGVNMSVRPSRVSFELFNGIRLIPEQYVLHKCDNRKCVNPDHLKLGTHQDNMDDMTDRNRQACGENNGAAKNTIIEIKYIRKLYNSNKYNIKEISRLVGKPYPTVYDIVKNRYWK